MHMSLENGRKRKFTRIILTYPVALIAMALLANFFLFGVEPVAIALPSHTLITAMIVAALLLLANHTWLMTSTELIRLRYDMHATPEEWVASGHQRSEVQEEGVLELERRHNAHANATENTIHFALLVGLTAIVSPVPGAALVWIVGFPAGRLGHTWAYLSGKDGARGLFMSVSLISLYGLASYLAVSLTL